ncbi:hypothetical protein OQ257_11560 [Actinobacillus equuli subsp. equuli]|uniref:Uncharacterized protein n=1 Tax=Actinobacillus equuli subsp. equuli TaxID=202947 RepID=A0A9X4JF27_ACTEU|nr:hypothetical protein [Actinobacillus equuli]MDE8035788.1 hypothetical protein [Actinobacillus equuli subsp. equuli]
MRKETADKTIRLKKHEAIELKELSFELTKASILNGHQKIYKESDIVHFLIEQGSKRITINKDGELVFKE